MEKEAASRPYQEEKAFSKHSEYLINYNRNCSKNIEEDNCHKESHVFEIEQPK